MFAEAASDRRNVPASEKSERRISVIRLRFGTVIAETLTVRATGC